MRVYLKPIQFIFAGFFLACVFNGCSCSLFADESWVLIVTSGDSEVVGQWIRDGGDVNARDRKGNTPLIHAINSGQAINVKILLEAGANPQDSGRTSKTPVAWAVEGGGELIVRMLICHGASFENQPAIKDVRHQKYTHLASFLEQPFCDEAAVGQLLEARKLILHATTLYQGRDNSSLPGIYNFALRRIGRVLGKEHPEYGVALNGLGQAYHAEGKYAKADSVLQISRKLLAGAPPRFRPYYGALLNNMAALNLNLGRFEHVEKNYEAAAALIAERFGHADTAYATVLNNLGDLYHLQGRHAEAESVFKEALEIRKSQLSAAHPARLMSLNNLASHYQAQKRYDLAEKLYRQIFEAYRIYGIEKDKHYAGYLRNLAAIYQAKKMYDAAEEMLSDAAELLENIVGPLHTDYAKSLNNLGVFYRVTRAYNKAENCFLKSQEIWRGIHSENHPLYARALYNLATIHIAQGREARAMEFLDEAIAILIQLKASYNLAPNFLIDALKVRAEMHVSLENMAPAIEDLEQGISLVEQQRVRIGGSAVIRSEYMENNKLLYDTIIQLLVAKGDVAEAFSYLQRSRARSFLDQFRLATLTEELLESVAEPFRSQLRERERQSNIRIEELNYQMALKRAQPVSDTIEKDLLQEEIEKLGKELKIARAAYVDVDHEIKTMSKRWNAGGTSESEAAGIPKVQQEIVPANGFVLSYLIGENESFLFGISRNDYWVEALTISDTISKIAGISTGPLTEAKLDSLFLGGGSLKGAGILPDAARSGIAPVKKNKHKRILHELYNSLIPEARRNTITTASELLIIPDGRLHSLPFEMLVIDQSGKYWIDEYASPLLRYGPSATALVQMKAQVGESILVNEGGVEMLSLSNPVYGLGDDNRTTTGNRTSHWERDGVLVELPHTAEETTAIKKAYGIDAERKVKVLTRKQATEAALREALGGLKYIHLATHGLTDETEVNNQGLFAALALALPDNVSQFRLVDDGLLELREVYQLDDELEHVELAVLSACETHVGPRFKGEGVFALSRGFMAAGADRVIASLWKVNDASTGALIGAVFEEILESANRGDRVDYAYALRKAQQTVRNNPKWSDPYYWAPFVLFGEA